MCTGCKYDPACVCTNGIASCYGTGNRSGTFWCCDMPEYDDWTFYTALWNAVVYCIRIGQDEDRRCHKRDIAHGIDHDRTSFCGYLCSGYHYVYSE